MAEHGIVYAVWDFGEYEVGDSREPRLVALTDTPQLATRIAAVLNGRVHPSKAMGYRYDFRADGPHNVLCQEGADAHEVAPYTAAEYDAYIVRLLGDESDG